MNRHLLSILPSFFFFLNIVTGPLINDPFPADLWFKNSYSYLTILHIVNVRLSFWNIHNRHRFKKNVLNHFTNLLISVFRGSRTSFVCILRGRFWSLIQTSNWWILLQDLRKNGKVTHIWQSHACRWPNEDWQPGFCIH